MSNFLYKTNRSIEMTLLPMARLDVLVNNGIVPPDDHTKLICTAALWINPLVALRSFFVCARKLAQKYTSLPGG
jgi:hypothetical protein